MALRVPAAQVPAAVAAVTARGAPPGRRRECHCRIAAPPFSVAGVTESDDSVTGEPAWAGSDLGVLIACYPQFRFCRARVGRRGLRWVAERIDGSKPGLHTMITADLGELRAALTQDRGRHER
jgi:hypothetical protein